MTTGLTAPPAPVKPPAPGSAPRETDDHAVGSPDHGPPDPAAWGRIDRHYRQTWPFYRFLWGATRHGGMHVAYGRASEGRHADRCTAMTLHLAETLDLTPGDRVLDLGCGIGGSGRLLATRYGVDVLGIDLLPRHVALARRLTARAGLSGRVRFLVGDMTRLPVADGSVAAVLMLETPSYADPLARLFSEIVRVLAPGGRVALTDGLLRREPVGRDRTLVRVYRRGWKLPHVHTRTAFAAAMEAAGLTDVAIVGLDEQTDDCADRMERLGRIGWPLLKLARRLGRPLVELEDATVAAILQSEARRSGLAGYDRITARKPKAQPVIYPPAIHAGGGGTG